MIITLVTDQYYQNNHGTSVSAQRFTMGLEKLGHTVRVVAIDPTQNTEFALKERNFGKPANNIIHSQGMQLGKPDEEVLKRAIKGADIVHVYLPFKLGYKTIQLCREMNVPCSAGFHIVPENITSTLYLNKSKLVNGCLWKHFKESTYKYINHIHCPSLMVANQLKKHNFNADLHVISNGYNDIFVKREESKPDFFHDKIVINFVGRFSREKRYDLIIKAVNTSKYRDKIQLVFGGKGPTKKKIMKMARKLPNYPIFAFLNRTQQISLLNFSYLYIHPADFEVEGLTAIEAIACGCVPIVSDSETSAVSQFTTHKKSLFKHGDYKDLAEKIDWWIEHPEEHEKEREKVVEHAKKYTIEKSMPYYIEMFEAAIKDWNKDFNFKKGERKPNIINNYK